MPIAFIPQIAHLFSRFSVPLLSNVTKISRSSLYRYKRLKAIPTQTPFNKLFNRYKSVMYTDMRYAGLPIAEAKNYKGAAPKVIKKIISRYDGVIQSIAEATGKKEDDIRDGVSQTDEILEDLEVRYGK